MKGAALRFNSFSASRGGGEGSKSGVAMASCSFAAAAWVSCPVVITKGYGSSGGVMSFGLCCFVIVPFPSGDGTSTVEMMERRANDNATDKAIFIYNVYDVSTREKLC